MHSEYENSVLHAPDSRFLCPQPAAAIPHELWRRSVARDVTCAERWRRVYKNQVYEANVPSQSHGAGYFRATHERNVVRGLSTCNAALAASNTDMLLTEEEDSSRV